MLQFPSNRSTLVWLLPVAVAVGLVLLVVVGIWVFGKERLPPPAELEAQALDETAPQEQRVQAALKLQRHGGAAQSQMRRLLAESDDSDVRAAAVQTLMENGDWEDVPRFIDALEDPSPWVRNRAARAVWKRMGTNFDFNPKAPPQQRAKAIEAIKREFQWQSDYREMHHESPTLDQRGR